MIYIVDGPDGTGKTTLSQALSNHLLARRYAFHKDSGYEDYLEALHNPFTAVWDRCFYDEEVYQPVMRPGEEGRLFTTEQYDDLRDRLRAHQVVFIFCTTIIREDDPYVSPEQNREVLRGYRHLLCRDDFNHMRVLEYDASRLTAEFMASFVTGLPCQCSRETCEVCTA